MTKSEELIAALREVILSHGSTYCTETGGRNTRNMSFEFDTHTLEVEITRYDNERQTN